MPRKTTHWRAPSLRGRIVVPPELVRELRAAYGLKQSEYARALGTSTPRLQRWEVNGADPLERLAFMGDLLTRGRSTLDTVTFYNLLQKLEANQFTLPLFITEIPQDQQAS